MFEIYMGNLLLRVYELLSFKFVMCYCIVKPWLWQFLFILILMICLINSIYYCCIIGCQLFESSINEWMNQIYPNKFWPRQTPRHILLILDYYRPTKNNFYSIMFSFITIQRTGIPLPPIFTSDSPHPTSVLML